MASPIPVTTRLAVNALLRKELLICGILSSVLYVAMNVFIPPLYEGYSSTTQTVSELSAIDAPTRKLWVWLGFVYTLLVLAFSFGILKSAGQNRKIRMTGILILAYGIVSLFWPLAPMHQREFLAAHDGGNFTDTMHLVLAGTTVVLMVSAMGFGAAAWSDWFRPYSIITILTLLVFGALTALDAPHVSTNLPTPMVGVWERINVGVFLVWIVMLSEKLLRKALSSGMQKDNKQKP